MAGLSTHVLDLVAGRPAAGMRVALWKWDGDRRVFCVEATTNADGRTDSPLLAGEALTPGVYEMVFQVARYFGTPAEACFLDEVPVRITVQAGSSYHVPLLCTPWAYQTYRGS